MVHKAKELICRSKKAGAVIIIALLAAMYALENFIRQGFVGGMVFTYCVRPILWMGVGCIVLAFPRVRAKSLLKHREQIRWLALYYAVIYIVVLVLAGLVDDFGRSPYSHSALWILINTVYFGSGLFGREMARNFLVNSLAEKERYSVLVPIALFMTLSSVGFNAIGGVTGYEEIVKSVAEHLLPAFSMNLFAVVLVYWGGPLASMIYMGVVQAVHWYCPVLPDLQWITTSIVGTLCPLFCMMLFQRARMEMAREIRLRDMKRDRPLGWVATSVFSIAVIWFAVGVFPICPTVIATGSMEPGINPGDVIIVDRRQSEDVAIGDVIQFRRDDVLISHRVIEVVEGDEGRSYRTKGDNNPNPDVESVQAGQVRGKVVYVAPKLGWPTLYVKAKNK